MKQYLKELSKQITPIILSALAAAFFSFVQSLVHQGGFCPQPIGTPEQVGALGAMIKAGHTAVVETKKLFI